MLGGTRKNKNKNKKGKGETPIQGIRSQPVRTSRIHHDIMPDATGEVNVSIKGNTNTRKKIKKRKPIIKKIKGIFRGQDKDVTIDRYSMFTNRGQEIKNKINSNFFKITNNKNPKKKLQMKI